MKLSKTGDRDIYAHFLKKNKINLLLDGWNLKAQVEEPRTGGEGKHKNGITEECKKCEYLIKEYWYNQKSQESVQEVHSNLAKAWTRTLAQL